MWLFLNFLTGFSLTKRSKTAMLTIKLTGTLFTSLQNKEESWSGTWQKQYAWRTLHSGWVSVPCPSPKVLRGKRASAPRCGQKFWPLPRRWATSPPPAPTHSPAARASVFWWQTAFSTRMPFIPICTGRYSDALPSRTSRCWWRSFCRRRRKAAICPPSL